jgi:putative endonuclease
LHRDSAPNIKKHKDGSHWGLSFFYDVKMMVTVYILYSEKADRYYIGQTSELEERLKRHNQGDSAYTKFGIPWKLVYKEQCASRSEAMKRREKTEGLEESVNT